MDEGPNTTLIHRETRALAVLLVIAIAAFVATRTVAHANQTRRERDAQAWFARGEGALQRGDARTAAPSLRRATALDPSQLPFRLALASALTLADAAPEARRVLLEARVTAPHNPEINLALGRLEAGHGEAAAAVNAFQAALNDLWRTEDARRRYDIRLELARYLLERQERSRALSELLIVSADMPDAGPAHAEVGGLFLRAGEPSRALIQFERSLALDQANQSVHLAAGQAAFALGDDTRALRHLRAASDLPAARDLASTITLALAYDPLRPRLSSAERERRLRAGVAQVRTRLEGCTASARAPADPSSSPLREQLDRFEASLTPSAGRTGAPVVDQLDDGVELVARIEEQSAACSPTTPLDDALILIGHRHEAKS